MKNFEVCGRFNKPERGVDDYPMVYEELPRVTAGCRPKRSGLPPVVGQRVVGGDVCRDGTTGEKVDGYAFVGPRHCTE